MKINKEKLLHKNLIMQVKDIDEENFIIRGVFSTQDEDRHGEVIDQNGWKLDEYMENPVVLFAHDQWTPAIGQMVELAIDKTTSKLTGAIKFAVEEYELAKTIFNLYKGRYMRAFSVGFMNTLEEIATADDGDESIVLRENTLYEVSCVNVPANTFALAKSKGIDTNPIGEAMKTAKKKELESKIVNKEVDLSDKTIEKISESIYKTIQKQISTDKAVQPKNKVETPAGKGDIKKRFPSNRKINKAIRQLLKERSVEIK